MHLQERIDILVKLGNQLKAGTYSWQDATQRAFEENSWFTPEFINLAATNIGAHFLDRDKLHAWSQSYSMANENSSPREIGVVMAGNIPMVGFHDLLSVFITGHRQRIKLSSKDKTLLTWMVEQLYHADERCRQYISFSDMLKNCDGYIATGSNNSARYFDYYFGKYAHLIRRNRTSVAVLTGAESSQALESLAGDIMLYFGLGCRNVSKVYIPANYDFGSLLAALSKYKRLAYHNKYKNNYDYQLTLLILNKQIYMSNEVILLSENPSPFSPISVLHYEYYSRPEDIGGALADRREIQCVLGGGFLPFGKSQQPSLADYADGADTLQFLLGI